jgi:hypothetical protein
MMVREDVVSTVHLGEVYQEGSAASVVVMVVVCLLEEYKMSRSEKVK